MTRRLAAARVLATDAASLSTTDGSARDARALDVSAVDDNADEPGRGAITGPAACALSGRETVCVAWRSATHPRVPRSFAATQSPRPRVGHA